MGNQGGGMWWVGNTYLERKSVERRPAGEGDLPVCVSHSFVKSTPGFRRRVAQGKDDRSVVDFRHLFKHLFVKRAAYGAHPNQRRGFQRLNRG